MVFRTALVRRGGRLEQAFAETCCNLLAIDLERLLVGNLAADGSSTLAESGALMYPILASASVHFGDHFHSRMTDDHITPKARIASATRTKPAMLAPRT